MTFQGGDDDEEAIPRVKPLKYTYEKEIVMYAHFKKLVYFSTECIFAPNAYRGHARAFLKDLEKVRPSVIMDIIHSGEQLQFKATVKKPVRGICNRCGFVSSQQPCKACVLLEGLNRGLPKLGIGKRSRADRMIAQQEQDLAQALREKAHLVKNDFWQLFQTQIAFLIWIMLKWFFQMSFVIIIFCNHLSVCDFATFSWSDSNKDLTSIDESKSAL